MTTAMRITPSTVATTPMMIPSFFGLLPCEPPPPGGEGLGGEGEDEVTREDGDRVTRGDGDGNGGGDGEARQSAQQATT